MTNGNTRFWPSQRRVSVTIGVENLFTIQTFSMKTGQLVSKRSTINCEVHTRGAKKPHAVRGPILTACGGFTRSEHG